MSDKRIIEVNGVKLEVDLSTARKVEEYRIGDVVKVLIKEYGTYKSHAGTIVGFDPFKERPTIIIAYLTDTHEPDVKFVYFHKDSVEIEICPACADDLSFSKESVVESMNRKIAKLKVEVSDIEQRRDFFMDKFSHHFGS